MTALSNRLYTVSDWFKIIAKKFAEKVERKLDYGTFVGGFQIL